VPGVASLDALHRAAADFAVTDLSLVIEPSALAAARQSLDESGFLLLGEVHGVRENPLIVRALMQAFGLNGLALEWPEDLTPMARAFLTGGTLADHPWLAVRRVCNRDTGPMHDPWIHVGRLWTNGEPFLAVDAALRDAWQGFSNDEFDQVVGLDPRDTSIPVGAGRAVLVGVDGVVRDDSWIEVFEAASGLVAIVQACGPDYPDVLARALDYPEVDDEDGDTLKVSSGELAIFSAAVDGTGLHSVPLLTPQPGPVPPVHGPPSRDVDQGILFSTAHTAYQLKVRWYTELDEDNCFARWLLIPARTND
jgi:hypothetical protein